MGVMGAYILRFPAEILTHLFRILFSGSATPCSTFSDFGFSNKLSTVLLE